MNNLLAEDASISHLSWDGREYFAEVSSQVPYFLADGWCKTRTRYKGAGSGSGRVLGLAKSLESSLLATGASGFELFCALVAPIVAAKLWYNGRIILILIYYTVNLLSWTRVYVGTLQPEQHSASLGFMLAVSNGEEA